MAVRLIGIPYHTQQKIGCLFAVCVVWMFDCGVPPADRDTVLDQSFELTRKPYGTNILVVLCHAYVSSSSCSCDTKRGTYRFRIESMLEFPPR